MSTTKQKPVPVLVTPSVEPVNTWADMVERLIKGV